MRPCVPCAVRPALPHLNHNFSQHLVCAWPPAAQLGNPCQANRFLPFHSLIQDSCGDGIEIPLLQIERIDGILFLMLEHAKHINISLTLFLLGIGNAIPVQAFGNTEFYSGKFFFAPMTGCRLMS